MAGAAQTLVSTPLLTLRTHFISSSTPMQSLWSYTYSTIRHSGLRSTYSPLRSTLVKESLSYGLFFGVFEFVKQQGYYKFLDLYYGGHRPVSPTGLLNPNERKPHWSISPAFVILAGSSASLAHSVVAFPMHKIQQARYRVPISYREFLSSPSALRVYIPSFLELIRGGGLYRGFLGQSVRMIPSTSVALIIFEAIRRKFDSEGEGIWGGEVVVPT
jgi:Mitochondrial carrier protein